MTTSERAELAVLGLLHDIGKFWQRAEASHEQPLSPGYESYGKEDFGTNGAHATWSAAFVERYVPRLIQDFSPILFHHKPSSEHPQAQRIALADRLASGERADANVAQVMQQQSVFGSMGGTRHYFPLEALRIEPDVLFPQQKLSESQLKSAYQTLWQQFVQDVENRLTDQNTLDGVITSLMALMQQYTWCVPAAFYRSVPDISLYDHSRVTAAVGVCVADIDNETVSQLLQGVNQRQPDAQTQVAYLLSGDISGVQHFIYTITARGATSALRGRSFYIQTLTDAIANYVLRQLQLPITNLIYSGGGNFTILIPASEYEQVAVVQQQLDQIMLKHHRGELYVALGLAPLTAADFQVDAFHHTWKKVLQDVGRAKRQRFNQLSPSDLSAFFAPVGRGGDDSQECQVTHYEGADVETETLEDGSVVRKSAMVRTLEQLGKQLRGAEAIMLTQHMPEACEAGTGYASVLLELGYGMHLYQKGKWHFDGHQRLPDQITIAGFQGTPPDDALQLIQRHYPETPLIRAQRFITNVAPHYADSARAEHIVAFEDLQAASTGLKRLGVLRMDVDDLGQLFAQGFTTNDGANYATLARVASLSFSMQLYFEGWVSVLCEQMNDAQYRAMKNGTVYSIYSGGDDLFIVGAWDHLVELAQQIREDFRAFTGERADLSGGLTLHGGKEPLYQSASAAHSALDAAKDLHGKGGFAILGQPLKWEQFFIVQDYVAELIKIVGDSEDNHKANRSILQILLQLYAQFLETRRTQQQTQAVLSSGTTQVVWGPYMWRGVYQLTRLAERSSADIQSQINEIRQALQNDNFQNIELLGVAARLAEALTRQTSA